MCVRGDVKGSKTISRLNSSFILISIAQISTRPFRVPILKNNLKCGRSIRLTNRNVWLPRRIEPCSTRTVPPVELYTYVQDIVWFALYSNMRRRNDFTFKKEKSLLFFLDCIFFQTLSIRFKIRLVYFCSKKHTLARSNKKKRINKNGVYFLVFYLRTRFLHKRLGKIFKYFISVFGVGKAVEILYYRNRKTTEQSHTIICSRTNFQSCLTFRVKYLYSVQLERACIIWPLAYKIKHVSLTFYRSGGYFFFLHWVTQNENVVIHRINSVRYFREISQLITHYYLYFRLFCLLVFGFF